VGVKKRRETVNREERKGKSRRGECLRRKERGSIPSKLKKRWEKGSGAGENQKKASYTNIISGQTREKI